MNRARRLGVETDAINTRNSKCAHGGVTDLAAPNPGALNYVEGINKDTSSCCRTRAPRISSRCASATLATFVISPAQQTLAIGAGETARLRVSAKAVANARIGSESLISVDVASTRDPSLSTYGAVALEVTQDLDRDDDALLDDQDNCVDKANPDQLDYDKDGAGNACDATPGEPPPETGCMTAPDAAPSRLSAQLAALLVGLVWLMRRRVLRGRP